MSDLTKRLEGYAIALRARGDERTMEAALVTEAVYALRNPLGGPASMLEEAANRVRAGEDFHAVLGDYGLADGERTEKLEAFVAKVRASKRRVCGEHGPVD